MELIRPPSARDNPGHYSPGVISGGMLYISGQLSLDPETGKAPAGYGPQADQCLRNLDAVLRQAGLTRESVVLCRVYVSDIAGWEQVNRAYAAFFGGHRPARAVVPTGPLHHGCLVEIEAMAELPE